MDLFRDAKEEVEEGSLASEVENVSIDDLLGDVVGISQRLGVATKKVDPEVAPAVVEVRLEPEIEAEDQAAGIDDEPLPAVTPVILRQVRIEEAEENPDGDVASSEEPVSLAGATGGTVGAPAYRESGNGQRYLLHVLFLGLTVAMGAGLGIRGAHGDRRQRMSSNALSAGIPEPACGASRGGRYGARDRSLSEARCVHAHACANGRSHAFTHAGDGGAHLPFSP
jgi:hypothetical protein